MTHAGQLGDRNLPGLGSASDQCQALVLAAAFCRCLCGWTWSWYNWCTWYRQYNSPVTLNPAAKVPEHSRNFICSRYLFANSWGIVEIFKLHALLLRPGTILTRAELEERIYGWNEEVESNAVDFLIHGVRRKFGATTIKNVRGAGWMVDKPS